MLRFHVDEHMPAALVSGARRKGIDITAPADVGLLRADDLTHLRWASLQGRMMVTNDEDFVTLHNAGHDHAGILYFPGRRPPVGRLLFWVELCHACVEPADVEGRVEWAR